MQIDSFKNLADAIDDITWLHAPDNWQTRHVYADTFEEAEQIATRGTEMSLMAHIATCGNEEYQYYAVHFATPEWVDNYYRNGGIWGYNWHHPEVPGWFADVGVA